MKEYNIQYSGLENGNYVFDFKINETFFSLFEYSEIEKADIEVSLEIDKKENLMDFHFIIDGTLQVPCDRCAREFALPVEGNNRLVVKFGEETYEQSEDILILASTEYQINVAQYIYEFITLSIPSKRVHPKGECDEEMVKRINELSKKPEKDNTDPRWEGLSDLLKNDN